MATALRCTPDGIGRLGASPICAGRGSIRGRLGVEDQLLFPHLGLSLNTILFLLDENYHCGERGMTSASPSGCSSKAAEVLMLWGSPVSGRNLHMDAQEGSAKGVTSEWQTNS